MKRSKSKFPSMILLGLFAANLLVAVPGWAADNGSRNLSAPPAFIFLPLILKSSLAPGPAQKAAIMGAEMLLLASDEES